MGLEGLKKWMQVQSSNFFCEISLQFGQIIPKLNTLVYSSWTILLPSSRLINTIFVIDFILWHKHWIFEE